LPELLLNLYYFGTDLRPSLYKVWGKSEEVRKHTGLLIFDRKVKEMPFSITKVQHAPILSRPLGVHLPTKLSICGCNSARDDEGTWIHKREVPNGRESIFIYRSACCATELQVAIFPGRRRTIQRNDTLFVEEDWNVASRSFDFKECAMVRMKVFVSVHLVKDVCFLFTYENASAMMSSKQAPPCALTDALDKCRKSVNKEVSFASFDCDL
jgi:hypothetical protein